MMRAFFAPLVVAILALALCLPGGPVFADSPPAYLIVVHPSNPTTDIDRRFLSEAFLKKTTRWPHGEVIKPADQSADSAVRRRFTADVHRRSVAEVRSYWQQIIFSGRDVPPPELNSDEEVVKYVLKYAGAIGYVAGGTSLGGAKAIPVR